MLIGVKQGDPPSPYFFNVYMNDLCSDLLNSNNIDTPKISDLAVPCLFWADDLVLISESERGKVFYRKQSIDSVKGYKYLGIWLDCNGKFNRAMNESAKKGMKATHSIYKLSTCNYISTEVL